MPAFPYLFILCVEILGNAIRNCDQIKEICVLDSECKISQYADDTTSNLGRFREIDAEVFQSVRFFRIHFQP